jgi:hypothetical protein
MAGMPVSPVPREKEMGESGSEHGRSKTKKSYLKNKPKHKGTGA